MFDIYLGATLYPLKWELIPKMAPWTPPLATDEGILTATSARLCDIFPMFLPKKKKKDSAALALEQSALASGVCSCLSLKVLLSNDRFLWASLSVCLWWTLAACWCVSAPVCSASRWPAPWFHLEEMIIFYIKTQINNNNNNKNNCLLPLSPPTNVIFGHFRARHCV